MTPLAFVVPAPLVAALLPLALPRRSRKAVRTVLAAAAASLAFLAIGRVDALSLTFVALVSIVGALATAFSAGGAAFERRDGDLVGDPDEAAAWSRVSVYYGLLGGFWSAMLLVVVASNFTVLWLGISATTLATAFLVGFSGEPAALEAAWKYLVLCSVGIAFALLGMLMLAHVTLAGGLDPAHALSWTDILRYSGETSPPLARLAIAFMIVGFATKAGLVPMHAWLPDAHSKAPAPVSGLLSGVLVSCALYALMRTLQISAVLGVGPFAHDLLLCFGALSTLVAGALMMSQRDLKRLLAYSTVENAGIVALALGFGGTLGLTAALVHVVAHAFSKSAAFFATGLVQRDGQSTSLNTLRALWESGGSGRLLLAALAALGALPPFGMFVSEFLVVAAGVVAGQWVALACGIAGMALSFAALSRAAIEIESGHLTHERRKGGGVFRLVPISAGSTALALAGTVAAGVLPWTAAGTALQSAASLLGSGAP